MSAITALAPALARSASRLGPAWLPPTKPTEIMPAYRTMYVMTGRYLAIEKKFDEALLAYHAAITLDPKNSSLESEMALVESRAHK